MMSHSRLTLAVLISFYQPLLASMGAWQENKMIHRIKVTAIKGKML
jgi:hypothetical protein